MNGSCGPYINVDNDLFCSQCEFLGCMSFGVSHIQKRQVAGWYYLLTGDVGRKKHLAVSEKRVGLSDRSGKNIPSVNQDVMWMEPHMVSSYTCKELNLMIMVR